MLIQLAFPDLFFFVPRIILELNDDQLNIGSLENDHAGYF